MKTFQKALNSKRKWQNLNQLNLQDKFMPFSFILLRLSDKIVNRIFLLLMKKYYSERLL